MAAVPIVDNESTSPQRRLATIDDLLQKMRGYLPQADLAPVRQAYEFAAAAHEGQRRGTGEPYVQHPLETAIYLADLQMDRATVEAGLLHDVPEDTDRTLADIEASFGPEVGRLVDGVTKLSGISWESRDEQQAENLRKMFLAMAEDIRVVLIKLCDRLHNVSTLDGKPQMDRRRIARETLDIYAPLAHRLGIWELKWRLEDGAFRHLEPEKYQELKRLLNDTRKSRERYISEAIQQVTEHLEAINLHAIVTGRPKHIYSIYNKMQRTGRSFDQLYDLLAIRVLVETLPECYAALGVVHSMWPQVAGQFDDYISVPKGNMYQSLHTAVIGPGGRRLEVQIRTTEMHQVAEHGIAAHWRYKETGGSRHDPQFEAKLAWLRQLMAWQQELSTAQEFVESVKMDVFQDQVYVFTPKGEVKDLPAGATPLDFAYRIHTDVGHRCIGARVNSKLVPLDYELKNGDMVEILTSKSSHGPSRDWLNLVRTAHAREKIRQWFKQQQRAENITRGKEALDRELRRLGLGGLGAIPDEKLADAAEALKQPSVDLLLAAIGYGGIGVQTVLSRLGLRAPAEPLVPELPELAPLEPSTTSAGAINVMGVGDLLTRIAACCKPVPGDPIVGFITRGKGINVHRADCVNVLNEDEPERLVPVEWGRAVSQQTYPVTIRVEADDREGLLRDVSTVVTEERLNITGAEVRVNPTERVATILATVEVNGVAQLSRLLAKIEQIKDVIAVSRDARAPSRHQGAERLAGG
jgi:GTP pyrophosphokinase